MINNLSYLSFLNKKIFITDEELNYKFGLDKLLVKNQYEFNLYKENIKYLVTETLENDGLFRYVLKNMANKNYVFAISFILLKDDDVIGSISLTKKTYALCLYKLLSLGLKDTALTRAHKLLSFTTIEECKKNNTYSTTQITFKDGNKISINNIDLINIFNSSPDYINVIANKNNISVNNVRLLMLMFASTGILKKYLFSDSAYIMEEELRHIDISSLVIEKHDKPKQTLNIKIYNKLFDYMDESYTPFEKLMFVYKQMKDIQFSIQTLAFVAENLGIEYKLDGNLLEIWYEEYNILFSKERFRIQTDNSSTRMKVYEIDDKLSEDIINKRTTETRLFNNIAYYKNFYLTDGPSDSEKLITFLRIASFIKDYDSTFLNRIEHIYKKILGHDENSKLYVITNDSRNKEMKKVIPIVVVKYNDTYYVIDPISNIKVNNYKDINNYLENKEYYSEMIKGCDFLNA